MVVADVKMASKHPLIRLREVLRPHLLYIISPCVVQDNQDNQVIAVKKILIQEKTKTP